MQQINTKHVIDNLNAGEVIEPSVIRRMVAELDQHRINELVTTHYQGRMREILHAAG